MFETYWAHRESPVLADPGDVVVHKLTVRLPRPRGRHTSEVEAEFDLVVRLSAAEAPEVNELLAFRGAGMVVRRLQLDRLSAAARPFHAMLVGGLAKRDPSEADQSVEQFLRDAEPPSHDDWEVTPRLKQAWIRGYATAIRQIWDRSKETLRRLVSPPIEERDEGPAGLRRLFPVSGEGRGRGESSFRFGNLDAQLDGDVWSFRGEVEPAEPLEGAWQVRVDARVPDEGGTNQLVATLDAPGASARVEDGVGAIHAEPGTSAVAFEGTTRVSRFPLTPDRSSLELVVVGSEVVE